MLDLLASLRLPLLGLVAMVVVFAGALPSREKWDRQSVVRLTSVGMAVSEGVVRTMRRASAVSGRDFDLEQGRERGG